MFTPFHGETIVWNYILVDKWTLSVMQRLIDTPRLTIEATNSYNLRKYTPLPWRDLGRTRRAGVSEKYILLWENHISQQSVPVGVGVVWKRNRLSGLGASETRSGSLGRIGDNSQFRDPRCARWRKSSRRCKASFTSTRRARKATWKSRSRSFRSIRRPRRWECAAWPSCRRLKKIEIIIKKIGKFFQILPVDPRNWCVVHKNDAKQSYKKWV